MDFYDKNCRICLTTEDDVAFKLVQADDDLVKRVLDVYNINIATRAETPVKICRQCELDVDTAKKVYNNIIDSNEYIKLFVENQTTIRAETVLESSRESLLVKSKTNSKANGKTIFECGTCLDKFKDIKSLDIHIFNHNNFACFFCKNIFSNVVERQEHLEAVHEETKKLERGLEAKCPSRSRDSDVIYISESDTEID